MRAFGSGTPNFNLEAKKPAVIIRDDLREEKKTDRKHKELKLRETVCDHLFFQGTLMHKTSQEDKYAIALRERQKHVDAIVAAPTDKKLVVAGPGTGKTHLFKTVLHGKTNTLTLTFVNALVEDLSLELFGLSDVKTLHGFARGVLKNARQKSVEVYPKLSTVIRQDAGILLRAEIDFDNLFHNRVDEDPRLEFYKRRKEYYGHYGFSDLIYAAALYFELHEDRIPVYSQVVVDEFQDFNALEVSLIDLLAKKSPVLLAGDDDQALYESLKSASAKHIRERHIAESPAYSCFNLPYCSRSTRVIVGAANDILLRAKENGNLSGRIDKPFRYFEDPKKDQESDANPQIVFSRVFSKQIPWFIQDQVKEITGRLREKFTVLVLSPTRTQCRGICEKLREKRFKNVHFVEKQESREPTLLDGLKLLLANDKCNLGWRLVSKHLLDESTFEDFLKQTVDQVEAKALLGRIDPDMTRKVSGILKALRRVRGGKQKVPNDELAELLSLIDRDAYGAATQSLKEELTVASPNPVDPGIRGISISATTIQSSKGLAADFVFITHFDDQYFVREKDKCSISDQDVCSFLVALTRARRRVYLLSTDTAKMPTFLKWIDETRIREISRSRGRKI